MSLVYGRGGPDARVVAEEGRPVYDAPDPEAAMIPLVWAFACIEAPPPDVSTVLPGDTATDTADSVADTAPDTARDTAADSGDSAADSADTAVADTSQDTSADTATDTATDTGDTGVSADAVADFLLPDLNPGSLRYGQVVSPRDYLEQVSGWYFTHST